MKRALGRFAVIPVGCALAFTSLACATRGGKSRSGFLDGYYQDLRPGPKGGARERWIKPGVDFLRYDKVMVDSVIFYFAPDSEDKGIDAQTMKELSDAFNLEMLNALKDAYPIVTEPAPDVMRIRVAITNIKKSKPVLSAVTSVIPVGLGVSVIRKGVTGAWSGSGDIRMEFMALDSMANEVVAAGIDERAAGFTERFTDYGSAREAMKFWAGRIRTLMDIAHKRP